MSLPGVLCILGMIILIGVGLVLLRYHTGSRRSRYINTPAWQQSHWEEAHERERVLQERALNSEAENRP